MREEKQLKAYIKRIEYYLPETELHNEELAAIYPEWTADKIYEKTGISSRHIAGKNETATDLAEKACEKLFANAPEEKDSVNFLIFMTQSPDYKLPPSACILQNRLGLSKRIGAFDVNLGCSAYIYGLATAKALIVSGMAKNVLLVTGETYSKYINPFDKSTRTLFGDGATATLISTSGRLSIDEIDYGTDGAGFDKLIVPAGMSRLPCSEETKTEQTDENGYVRSQENIFMDGAGIFSFTIEAVPDTVSRLLEKSGRSKDDVELFVFHQANKFMLSYLKKKLRIPDEKFYIDLETRGNTVSSSIPIALKDAAENGRLPERGNVMAVGFGVGLSWGSAMLRAE